MFCAVTNVPTVADTFLIPNKFFPFSLEFFFFNALVNWYPISEMVTVLKECQGEV
jgi:hypothetical protein